MVTLLYNHLPLWEKFEAKLKLNVLESDCLTRIVLFVTCIDYVQR